MPPNVKRATPAQIRSATEFLAGKGLLGDISARMFATAVNELGKSFADTLKIIAELLEGGQGQVAPEARKYL